MIKKNLCLIKKFYKDIRLSSLLLFIVFLLAQFSMLSLIGKYRTCMYYDRCYKHIPDVERSVYYGYEANLMTGTSDTRMSSPRQKNFYLFSNLKWRFLLGLSCASRFCSALRKALNLCLSSGKTHANTWLPILQ